MKVIPEVQQLLEDYIVEIENGDFVTIYEESQEHDPDMDVVGAFTEALLSIDVDPLKIDKNLIQVYNGMYFGCDIHKLVIPKEIKTIGYMSFANCLYLHDIKFQETSSLYEIGRAAFYKSEDIKEIELPDSVRTIEALAFASCTSLSRISLPKELYVMEHRVFQSTMLTEIEYRGTIEEFKELHQRASYEWHADSSISLVKCVDGELEIQDLYFGSED